MRLKQLEDQLYTAYAKAYYYIFEGQHYSMETDYLRLNTIHFIRESFKNMISKVPCRGALI